MKVLSTNGVKSLILDLLPSFERQGGKRVDVTWGSTFGLTEDIESGVAADVAVLTAEAIDDLLRAGKAVAGSRVDLARSAIGVAVRKGAEKPDIGSADAFKRALLAAKSIAHSRTGISGLYFPQVLARLGIGEEVKSRLVLPEPGTPVGELIAKGEAELGIQQVSELLPVAGVEIVGPLPPELQKITTFSAAVLATATDPPGAKELVNFIAVAARPLLQSKGLELP